MKRPFVLGLTGSVGMGKSTTATMFAEAGVPVWDADAVVHRLYASGGAGVDAIRRLCAECIVDGAVDRTRLKTWLGGDPKKLATLESVVHPLVSQDRNAFIAQSEDPVILLDIPLLYEIEADGLCDAVVVVTAPEDIQRDRVRSRPGMTEALLQDILTRQMPDAKKRDKADYIIETLTLEGASRQVQDVLKDIRDRIDARNRVGHGNNGIRP